MRYITHQNHAEVEGPEEEYHVKVCLPSWGMADTFCSCRYADSEIVVNIHASTIILISFLLIHKTGKDSVLNFFICEMSSNKHITIPFNTK